MAEPSREPPISILVVVGMVVGALLAGGWAWHTNGAATEPALVESVGRSESAWTDVGWDVDDDAWKASVVRITTDRCGDVIRGSGVVVNGAVLTNRHVVDGASSVVVTTADGEVTPVLGISASDDVDVANLAIDRSDVADLELAAGDPRVGADDLTLAGFPAGHGFVARDVRVEDTVQGWEFPDPRRALHLDVDVAGGESGSAIVDAEGRLAALLYGRALADGRGLAIGASELRTARAGLAPVAFAVC